MANSIYTAPILVALLGLIFTVESYVEKMPKAKLWMHYPTWLYIMFFVLMVVALISTEDEIMSITSGFDAATTDAYVREKLAADGELDQYEIWKEEASLEGWDYLKAFSMSTRLWLVLTYVVCLYHTFGHLKVVKTSGLGLSHGQQYHNRTIYILALPMVYGIMSYKSVMRMWEVSMDHQGGSSAHNFKSFEARKAFLMQMSEANFMVGDIYEALALVQFGQLITDYIRIKVFVSGGEQLGTGVSVVIEAMKDLTTYGVQLFYWCCLANATYLLLVTSGAYYLKAGLLPDTQIMRDLFSTNVDDPGMFFTESMISKSGMFFTGAGFVASFAAIGNIIKVESRFEGALEEFGSFYKFWGTKVLVSLAFLQKLILGMVPPFSGWSETRSELLYASLMSFECFLIAVLHLKSWSPQEAWYCCNEDEVSSKSQPLLA